MNVHPADWTAVEAWWTQAGVRDADVLADLQTVFTELNEQWRDSPACFDQDPLCAGWRDDGPLRTTQEENWSQWLAHLCDTAPPDFITNVFNAQVAETPTRTRCEVPVSTDAATDRRADILLQYPETGISIEVKIDDTNYGKTPDTARLIEQHNQQRTWQHYLLLPATNSDQLRADPHTTLTDTNTAEAPHTVLRGTTQHEPDVAVLYWRDISRGLRHTLRTDASVPQHWQAAAYSFITIIETVLCHFALEPRITAHTTKTPVGFAEQLQLREASLADQYAYLTDTL